MKTPDIHAISIEFQIQSCVQKLNIINWLSGWFRYRLEVSLIGLDGNKVLWFMVCWSVLNYL